MTAIMPTARKVCANCRCWAGDSLGPCAPSTPAAVFRHTWICETCEKPVETWCEHLAPNPTVTMIVSYRELQAIKDGLIAANAGKAKRRWSECHRGLLARVVAEIKRLGGDPWPA